MIDQRCTHNPLFGAPRDIDTVDKFQGQQNDYVLLSLVRTRAVGHIRDVRRLVRCCAACSVPPFADEGSLGVCVKVVAMSRARLGLYVFGRLSLFQNCLELTNTFNVLLTKPTSLTLVPGEQFGFSDRKVRGAGP